MLITNTMRIGVSFPLQKERNATDDSAVCTDEKVTSVPFVGAVIEISPDFVHSSFREIHDGKFLPASAAKIATTSLIFCFCTQWGQRYVGCLQEALPLLKLGGWKSERYFYTLGRVNNRKLVRMLCSQVKCLRQRLSESLGGWRQVFQGELV